MPEAIVRDRRQTVPVTILTGFLGAGKTTLLNYILTEKHGYRIAIIENEFGEVDVDSDLVMASEEEIFQVVNGCICCTIDVRNDLVETLRKLLARPEKFDYILVETSGLADPTPVASTFFVDNEVAQQVSLDGIVTLVDALHIQPHLEDAALERHDNQAVSQIVVSDRVLLNKTDLVESDSLAELERRIRKLNSNAPILHAEHARVDLAQVLGLGAYQNDMYAADRGHFMADDIEVHAHDHGHDANPFSDTAHEHDPSVGSVSLVFDAAVDIDRLVAFLEKHLADAGDDLYRYKGIVQVKDDARRYVLQGVHRIFEIKPSALWMNDPRSSKFVFIGRALDEEFLRQGIAACLADRPTVGEVMEAA